MGMAFDDSLIPYGTNHYNSFVRQDTNKMNLSDRTQIRRKKNEEKDNSSIKNPTGIVYDNRADWLSS